MAIEFITQSLISVKIAQIYQGVQIAATIKRLLQGKFGQNIFKKQVI